MWQTAEEPAQSLHASSSPMGWDVAAPFVDQGIAIGADVVCTHRAMRGDETLGREGIDQIVHPRAGGPTECEFPGLSQPGLEFREQADEIGRLQVVPEVVVIRELELFCVECGWVRARRASRSRAATKAIRYSRMIARIRSNRRCLRVMPSSANSAAISRKASFDQGRSSVGGSMTKCQPASVRTMRTDSYEGKTLKSIATRGPADVAPIGSRTNRPAGALDQERRDLVGPDGDPR